MDSSWRNLKPEFEHDYTDEEGILSWLLSFKDKVTVLEPESMREQLFHLASKLAERYGKEGENGV